MPVKPADAVVLPPDPLQNVLAQQTGENTIQVSWTARFGQDHADVYRDGIWRATVFSTPWTDPDTLLIGRTYVYTMTVTVSTNGVPLTSAHSAPSSIIRTAPPVTDNSVALIVPGTNAIGTITDADLVSYYGLSLLFSRGSAANQYIESGAFQGKDAMRYTLKARQINQMGSDHNLPPARGYRWTFTALFEPGFGFGGVKADGSVDWQRAIGKFGNLIGGGEPVGGGTVATDGFRVRYMWRMRSNGTVQIVLYVYYATMESLTGSGDNWGMTAYNLTPGVPVTLQTDVMMNETAAKTDGYLIARRDGVESLRKENVQWFTTGQPHIDRIGGECFHGGNIPDVGDARGEPYTDIHDSYIQIYDSSYELLAA
ncbi:polysaccharide lyase [uncultured Paraglaciecola sp.]|uniref:polysaccharide lyase n=1 Tax=uncultured Paraglaciecola sp. TaxID=1765024 RepID=UPI0026028AB1|nr:hypothetical protein [uncultured Paraglaciecola sp.]